MTKQRMAMRSNFPWSDFKKLGTPELSSSSSTSTALSPKNFEKRAHPTNPLIKPSESLINSIDILTFNFLRGCKRDKIKRDVIKGTISEGGQGLFDFSEFVISLKLTLIKKLIDQKFTNLGLNADSELNADTEISLVGN